MRYQLGWDWKQLSCWWIRRLSKFYRTWKKISSISVNFKTIKGSSDGNCCVLCLVVFVLFRIYHTLTNAVRAKRRLPASASGTVKSSWDLLFSSAGRVSKAPFRLCWSIKLVSGCDWFKHCTTLLKKQVLPRFVKPRPLGIDTREFPETAKMEFRSLGSILPCQKPF